MVVVHISLTWGELGVASSYRCYLRLKFDSIGGQSFPVLLDTGSSDLVNYYILFFVPHIDGHHMAVGRLVELYGPGLCKGTEV